MQRLREAALCVLLVVTAFHQSAGQIGNDTKLDLTADPGRFLSRSLSLWDSSAAFGRLQNQAYGYLWPMGPFHLLGYWLSIPAWIVQRSWMSLLLVVAFLGVVRLAQRLELGSPTTRLLGAMVFALSPRILTEVGGNSAELWPTAVLPWVLLPLVGQQALTRPRKAAAWSGVAVLMMGAANATTVLALLPLPALWLLPGLRTTAGRKLAAWWAVAVTLACTWWFVPLVLQGRYGTSFLDYIETANVTTGVTSPGEVLRGTSHWLGFLSSAGQPWWRSGWMLVTNGLVVFDTAVLTTLCLAGLLRKRMPGQGRLAIVAGLGLVAMSAGHVGPLDGPGAVQVQHLLDGALAPFRNVHKFQGLVSLPLALGLIHLVAQITAQRVRQITSGLVAVALVGASAPALAGELIPAGHYAAIPSYWNQAGTWLDQHDATGHTLVLPAAGFGEYTWGRPLDDPLQALTSTPWVIRDAVPLGSPGSTRLLDALDARFETGRGSAALHDVLARMGVTYVLVAGDLDVIRSGAPKPALIQQALDETPGIELAAAFGPVSGGQGKDRALINDDGLSGPLPTLAVYQVSGTPSPVTSMPTAGTWSVSGGPEALFQLADRGLLDGHATVLAGQGIAGDRAVLTDSLRRREIDFGSVRDNTSATLPPTGGLTLHRRVDDVLPVPGTEHLATAKLVGAVAVSASSSASDVGTLFHRAPINQPLSAFDGDPATSWISADATGAKGQWVQVDLDKPVDLTGTTIRMSQVGPGVPTAVTVRTDRGEVTTHLATGRGAQPLIVAEGLTKHLRITATAVKGDGFGSQLAISDVDLPAVDVAQTVVLPQDQRHAARPVVLLDRAVGATSGCLVVAARTVCSPELPQLGEDATALDRTFTLDSEGRPTLTGSVVAVPGKALDALLDKGSAIQVTASSTLVPDPAVRSGAVVDQDRKTGWVAGDFDLNPTLTLRWKTARQIDRVTIVTDAGLVAARPTEVVVTTPAGKTRLKVPADGVLRFPAVSTHQLSLLFTTREFRTSYEASGHIRTVPVGISEVTVPGIGSRSPAATSTVSLPCGQGPQVVVDGVAHPTAVLGSRADLIGLKPLLLGLCDTLRGLPLAAGEHRVVAGTRGPFAVEALTLGAPQPVAPVVRPTVVRQWDDEHRVVSVGEGDRSYLVVQENSNRGWQARLGGHQLQAVTIDGWQQAWVVPAGEGGQVTMTFAPGRTFRLGLAVGGALVLLLLLLVLVPARTRTAPEERPLHVWGGVRAAGGLVVLVLVGGAVGAAVGLGLLIGTAVLRRLFHFDPRDLMIGVCATALTAAGALTALRPWNGTHPPAAFGEPVAALVLVALAAAVAALSGPRSPSDASTGEPAAPPAEG